MPSQATQHVQPRVARRHGTVLAALAFALSTIGAGTAGLAAPPVSAAVLPAAATFIINIGNGWIGGWGFATAATIAISWNAAPLGLGEIVSDGYGNFWV